MRSVIAADSGLPLRDIQPTMQRARIGIVPMLKRFLGDGPQLFQVAACQLELFAIEDDFIGAVRARHLDAGQDLGQRVFDLDARFIAGDDDHANLLAGRGLAQLGSSLIIGLEELVAKPLCPVCLFDEQVRDAGPLQVRFEELFPLARAWPGPDCA